MNTESFPCPGKTVYTQDKASEYPCYVAAEELAFTETERIGTESGGLLQPVSERGQRGYAVLSYLAIAHLKGEVVAFFVIFHTSFPLSFQPGQSAKLVVLFPLDADFRILAAGLCLHLKTGKKLYLDYGAGIRLLAHALLHADIDIVADIGANFKGRGRNI